MLDVIGIQAEHIPSIFNVNMARSSLGRFKPCHNYVGCHSSSRAKAQCHGTLCTMSCLLDIVQSYNSDMISKPCRHSMEANVELLFLKRDMCLEHDRVCRRICNHSHSDKITFSIYSRPKPWRTMLRPWRLDTS